MKLGLILTSIFLFTATQGLAAENTKTESTVKTSSQTTPTKNENWYLYFDGGFIADSFSGDIKQEREAFYATDATQDDASSAGGFATSLAFYFPINSHKTMIGPTVSLGASTDTIQNTEGKEFDLSTFRFDLAFSLQHYFGANIGSGFFLRGDLGGSVINHTAEFQDYCFFDCDQRSTVTFQDGSTWTPENFGDERTKTGVSPLATVGLGYAWRIGSETRMQAQLLHSVRPSTIGTLQSTNLGMGWLF